MHFQWYGLNTVLMPLDQLWRGLLCTKVWIQLPFLPLKQNWGSVDFSGNMFDKCLTKCLSSHIVWVQCSRDPWCHESQNGDRGGTDTSFYRTFFLLLMIILKLSAVLLANLLWPIVLYVVKYINFILVTNACRVLYIWKWHWIYFFMYTLLPSC